MVCGLDIVVLVTISIRHFTNSPFGFFPCRLQTRAAVVSGLVLMDKPLLGCIMTSWEAEP